MFQDRIDDYLHDRMKAVDKEAFLLEVEEESEKKRQLYFTQKVKSAIRSREEKLRILTLFKEQYERKRKSATMLLPNKKKNWIWIYGVAAVFVVGIFVIRPVFLYDSPRDYNDIPPMKDVRGNDIYGITFSIDSLKNDTLEDFQDMQHRE